MRVWLKLLSRLSITCYLAVALLQSVELGMTLEALENVLHQEQLKCVYPNWREKNQWVILIQK